MDYQSAVPLSRERLAVARSVGVAAAHRLLLRRHGDVALVHAPGSLVVLGAREAAAVKHVPADVRAFVGCSRRRPSARLRAACRIR